MLIWKTWHRKEKDNNDEGNVTNLGHILCGIHENVYVDLLSWFCFFRVFADLKVGYIVYGHVLYRSEGGNLMMNEFPDIDLHHLC